MMPLSESVETEVQVSQGFINITVATVIAGQVNPTYLLIVFSIRFTCDPKFCRAWLAVLTLERP